MEATILDLRKNMKKIMSAIERRERVVLSRRRKKMAVIMPISELTENKAKVAEQQAFGMWADRNDMASVEDYVRNLRKPRSF